MSQRTHTNTTLRMGFSFGLTAATLEALQDRADRARDREQVEHARTRKVPVPYAQRRAMKGAR